MDKRKSLRYQVALPAKFAWSDAHRIKQRRQGTTRDISTFGVSVLSADVPAVGSVVDLEIELPLGSAGRRLEMHAQGRVLRSGIGGADGKRGGFAALSDGFNLFREERTTEESMAAPAKCTEVIPEGSDE